MAGWVFDWINLTGLILNFAADDASWVIGQYSSASSIFASVFSGDSFLVWPECKVLAIAVAGRVTQRCFWMLGDQERKVMKTRYLVLLPFLAPVVLGTIGLAQVPVFVIAPPPTSSVKFFVKASVALTGNFDKWDATLTFTSTDVTTGVLDIKIQAASVNSGSGMKDDKLRSKDFFDVKENPLITFHSTKVIQTGPTTFDVPGTFTIRGVSKPETLTLAVSGVGTGSGDIKGTMAFDRKDYGMNSGIPFIKIADRVEVTIDLKGKRVSGPPLALKP
jgi:polyisoprenoid-binding protein YceI